MLTKSTRMDKEYPIITHDTESDSGDDEGKSWEEWEGDDDGLEEEPTSSLFCSKVLNSAEAAMQFDAENYGFDIRQFAVKEHLEEYDIFRCINWIRSEVSKGVDPFQTLAKPSTSSAWLGNDEYLTPQVPEDPMLFYDYEEVIETWRSSSSTVALKAIHDTSEARSGDTVQLLKEIQRLKDENEGLKAALRDLAVSSMPEELLKDDLKPSLGESTAGPSLSKLSLEEESKQNHSSVMSSSKIALSLSAQAVDGSYFDSYGGFGIHQDMISDQPRTTAYQRAIEGNPLLFKGKKVLDVGCGTGILSLFACRAGASSVISVEGNERMAGFARQISKINGFSSDSQGPMTVIHGKLEDIEKLPEEKVDVIISEWMGYALLFETMLDTVLQARDRFLKPGGAVLPDVASIYIAGAGVGSTDSSFWKDVYGFSMTPIAEEVRKGELENANVHVVKASDIITNEAKIKELQLCDMTPPDQDFSSEFTLKATSLTPVECHAIVLWFDTDFSDKYCSETPVKLSTSVHLPPTHWSQTVLVLKAPVMLAVSDSTQNLGQVCASALSGRLSMVRSKQKHRFLDISLECRAELSDGSIVNFTSVYSMSVSS
ncbi:hypothetical protein CEUSTIGMA_g7511.t1 [Chlamydomonas eustigma]|uniref:type I protein arginine methyltransferase n=1 Tax=Chlamydomonas eustigma TaxID=1157962 RepID=A0A250XAD0_9CHLO|nr:hypothetical protein CEUSTIGMA_g7511.t1 [Chlamydomonas eustigma]|eukprot:GAX80073.1 hypothetical protein CEUSTIGMA_g7511.t1 [Chlamydomonas eustigma]